MKAKIAECLTIFFGILAVPAVQVCQAQTQHQVTTLENLHFKDDVSISLKTWQEIANIRITPDAQESIQEGFAAEQKRLQESFDKQKLSSSRASEFIDSLVYHYLYDLRDRKLVLTMKDETPPASGYRSYFFQQSHEGAVTIGKSDVEAFPPQKFLQELQRVLENEVGHIDVLSDPDLATITIDGEKKPQLTCRTFVVSPGDHSVNVYKPKTNVNCSETVSVTDGATEQVPCPKKAKMKCHLPTN